ncbi:GNAT family N-acetyltransferase [Ruegeria sp. Ofav3-42]|uniref:GNAT family N-acetyltransferase n=1 Tax=Ruegeria sp. Ofav3-42 TaxID=2917759 RepID=UPI001EF717A2|nr:GNAT family protein [Ruegeria sp. Ofav3-42]MCG7522514.1 GNAT family N-acetyltransferase [Ruegeria sp. Ofav3-42]
MAKDLQQRHNEHNQPIGFDVPDWKGALPPEDVRLQGTYCRLEPLDLEGHTDDLFDAFSADTSGKSWTYMPVGPFQSRTEFRNWMTWATSSADPLFSAIVDQKSGRAVGFASYMRISPETGVIEVGYIAFSPLIQKSRLATEAMYLMMKLIFDDLGYRRYEWKCDNLNQPSHNAARRLGFTYDGLFRQALVYKGRNRDTAWYSILDRDWPRLKSGFERWLSHENFSSDGTQKSKLWDFTG